MLAGSGNVRCDVRLRGVRMSESSGSRSVTMLGSALHYTASVQIRCHVSSYNHVDLEDSLMNATRRALLLAVGGLGLSRLSRNVSAQTEQSRPADAFMRLPPNLPVPVDDGACRHLSGMKVPSVPLQSTANRSVELSRVDAKRVVVYAYPRTGAPGQPVPAGWDEIPGARGCTPETCGFR